LEGFRWNLGILSSFVIDRGRKLSDGVWWDDKYE